MAWKWQNPDWPNFRFRHDSLAAREALFLRQCGVVVGSVKHLGDDERLQLVIDLISTEALKTSEIEGEILNRDSVQSSLRRQFGLQPDARRGAPAQQGIAAPLTDDMLVEWHRLLMQGRRDVAAIGVWRTHADPMQVVSGPMPAPKVHFEAPPSAAVAAEMEAFCHWYNDTAPAGKSPLPAMTRAGLAHLYFESIHPFEDGNGRIGRALAEKALAQSAGQPSLTALSLTLQRRRAEYYAQLAFANQDLHVDAWLAWFAELVLAAQQYTLDWLEFLIAKTRLLDRLSGKLNTRQEKGLLRLLREGPDGFVGGLQAGNYMRITGTSAATARRDLGELVDLGALRRTGQLKSARYWLAIHAAPSA